MSAPWIADFLNRRARVEREMLDAAKEIEADDSISVTPVGLRGWAMRLGVPENLDDRSIEEGEGPGFPPCVFDRLKVNYGISNEEYAQCFSFAEGYAHALGKIEGRDEPGKVEETDVPVVSVPFVAADFETWFDWWLPNRMVPLPGQILPALEAGDDIVKWMMNVMGQAFAAGKEAK